MNQIEEKTHFRVHELNKKYCWNFYIIVKKVEQQIRKRKFVINRKARQIKLNTVYFRIINLSLI